MLHFKSLLRLACRLLFLEFARASSFLIYLEDSRERGQGIRIGLSQVFAALQGCRQLCNGHSPRLSVAGMELTCSFLHVCSCCWMNCKLATLVIVDCIAFALWSKLLPWC